MFYIEVLTRLMGELMGYVDQITSYGFSSTDLGNKAYRYCLGLLDVDCFISTIVPRDGKTCLL
ncbi:hypothetical protein FJD32_011570 [Shewanella sp. LC6]|nr:hypothetical protein FJD32_011570 [Shewanella sp. LC6]TPE47202.1 hypothetical protein FJD33_24175 [Shewanella sp. LC2]